MITAHMIYDALRSAAPDTAYIESREGLDADFTEVELDGNFDLEKVAKILADALKPGADR